MLEVVAAGREVDAEQESYVLNMIDQYQGQPGALFAADEVFAGRQPERGTETCLVVEAMASLELAFANLGDPRLMDRVERLAFNAMPAALDAEMRRRAGALDFVGAQRCKTKLEAVRRRQEAIVPKM